VRRHIWRHSPDVFRREAFPLLDELIADVDPREPLYDLLHDETTPAPAERRRQCVPLQRLLELVGDSSDLYKLLLATARTLFTSTKNDRFCALRADALMAMHDSQKSTVYESDPCHSLTWCIDACARDGRVDERLLAEMSQYVETVAIEIKSKQNLRVRFVKPDIKVKIKLPTAAVTAAVAAAAATATTTTSSVVAQVEPVAPVERVVVAEAPVVEATPPTVGKFKISKQLLASASSETAPQERNRTKRLRKRDDDDDDDDDDDVSEPEEDDEFEDELASSGDESFSGEKKRKRAPKIKTGAKALTQAMTAAKAALTAPSTSTVTVRDEKERMTVLADMALILRSPPSVAALVREIYVRVEACVAEQKLPADDHMLPRLTPLALLAMHARPLLAGDEKTPPPPEETAEMLQVFYALLAERIVDDRVRLLSNEAANATNPAPPLPPKLAKLLHRNEFARKVLLHYALHRTLADDPSGVDAVIEVFQRKLGDAIKKELPFAQSIVSALLSMPQHSAALRHVVLEKFLLHHVRHARSDPKGVCHRQLLRYLLQVHSRLPIVTLIGYVHVGIMGVAHPALNMSLALDGAAADRGDSKKRSRTHGDMQQLSGELARSLAPLYAELWQRVIERVQARREAAFWSEWLASVSAHGGAPPPPPVKAERAPAQNSDNASSSGEMK
jgi:hypothetical protein